MAQQFLQRAQVGPARKQMSGKAMSKCMRGQAVGQSEPAARGADRAPDQVRVEWSAARPEEQGRGARERIGTSLNISCDGFSYGIDDRHDPRLVALPCDAESSPDGQH